MSKKVRIGDVAEHAGVSVGTVSNVLNRPDYVSADNLRKVNDAMRELGFVRSDAARQLRQGYSTTIGMVSFSLTNPFFGSIAHAAQEEAEAHGYTIVVGSSDQDHEREDRYIQLFEQQKVRGLLIAPIDGVSERLADMRSRGTPVVLFNGSDKHTGFLSVSMDGFEAGRIAAEHLLESGRRRVLFAGGPFEQVRDRLAGASYAVARAEGAMLQETITDDLSIEEGVRVGRALVELPPERRPDAVFAANDLLALGILQALLAAGDIRIPEDIALIGYDDIPFAASATVPLTTIRQPVEAIAREAVRAVLSDAADELTGARVFPPELVVRRSTG